MFKDVKTSGSKDKVRPGIWLMQKGDGGERVVLIDGDSKIQNGEEYFTGTWWYRSKDAPGELVNITGWAKSERPLARWQDVVLEDVTEEYFNKGWLGHLLIEAPKALGGILLARSEMTVDSTVVEVLLKSADRKTREMGIRLIGRVDREDGVGGAGLTTKVFGQPERKARA